MYQYLTLTPDLTAAFSRLGIHNCNDSSHAPMKKDSEAVPTEGCSYQGEKSIGVNFSERTYVIVHNVPFARPCGWLQLQHAPGELLKHYMEHIIGREEAHYERMIRSKCYRSTAYDIRK